MKQKSYQYFQFTRASNMEHEYIGHFILLGPTSHAEMLLHSSGAQQPMGVSNTPWWKRLEKSPKPFLRVARNQDTRSTPWSVSSSQPPTRSLASLLSSQRGSPGSPHLALRAFLNRTSRTVPLNLQMSPEWQVYVSVSGNSVSRSAAVLWEPENQILSCTLISPFSLVNTYDCCPAHSTSAPNYRNLKCPSHISVI